MAEIADKAKNKERANLQISGFALLLFCDFIICFFTK